MIVHLTIICENRAIFMCMHLCNLLSTQNMICTPINEFLFIVHEYIIAEIKLLLKKLYFDKSKIIQ